MVGIGSVPKPEMEFMEVDTPYGSNWDDRGPRNTVAVCVHRMAGDMNGTLQWFRQGQTLADFMIGNLSDDGPGLDGVIWQTVELEGNKTPHANGWDDEEDPSVVTEGHGRVFYEKYLADYDLNRDISSIETSGDVGTDVSDNLFESLAWLIAYICD